jgi:cytochrome c peroxidase
LDVIYFWLRSRFSPTTFSNGFFKELLAKKWTYKKWDGPSQYEDETKSLMMLPTDMALSKDSGFRPLVEAYAKDESLFFKDFAKAYVKLSELGCSNLSSEVLEFKKL